MKLGDEIRTRLMGCEYQTVIYEDVEQPLKDIVLELLLQSCWNYDCTYDYTGIWCLHADGTRYKKPIIRFV